MDHFDIAQSFRVGQRLLILVLKISLSPRVSSRLVKISDTPKSPITRGMIPTPSVSSSIPKVKRGRPVTISSPTLPMRSPTRAIIMALRMEPCTR